MDKDLIMSRFVAAVGSYEREAVVQKAVAGRLAGLVAGYVPGEYFDRVLEVGCGTGLLTRAMTQVCIAPKVHYINDLCADVADLFEGKTFISGDAERVDFPGDLGLIVSSSAVQWFEDLPGFFRKCGRSLREGGFLAFSSFGPGNLEEVSGLTGRGLEYFSAEAVEAMLVPGYQVVYSEETEEVMSFDSPLDVLRHLKLTGVNGVGRQVWTRGDLADFCRNYPAAADSSCRLTYRPLYIVARKV